MDREWRMVDQDLWSADCPQRIMIHNPLVAAHLCSPLNDRRWQFKSWQYAILKEQ